MKASGVFCGAELTTCPRDRYELVLDFRNVIMAPEDVETICKWNQELPPLEITISKPREKRSVSANAFMWALADKIAKTLSKDGAYFSRVDIYREAVRDAGPFTTVLVANDAADTLKAQWSAQGVGWLADTVAEDGANQTINLYAGSSSYNTEEMARLISCLLAWCDDIGIHVETKAKTPGNGKKSVMERVKDWWWG